MGSSEEKPFKTVQFEVKGKKAAVQTDVSHKENDKTKSIFQVDLLPVATHVSQFRTGSPQSNRQSMGQSLLSDEPRVTSKKKPIAVYKSESVDEMVGLDVKALQQQVRHL